MKKADEKSEVKKEKKRNSLTKGKTLKVKKMRDKLGLSSAKLSTNFEKCFLKN